MGGLDTTSEVLSEVDGLLTEAGMPHSYVPELNLKLAAPRMIQSEPSRWIPCSTKTGDCGVEKDACLVTA
jgi:hypothetical protein